MSVLDEAQLQAAIILGCENRIAATKYNNVLMITAKAAIKQQQILIVMGYKMKQ